MRFVSRRGAVVAGVGIGAAIISSMGAPSGEMQDALFGDRNALYNVARSGVIANVRGDYRKHNRRINPGAYGTPQYVYGQQMTNRNLDSTIVDGSVVLGMWNLRR